MEIDHIDRRILEVLQKSGRMSNAELSDMVNLSAIAEYSALKKKDSFVVMSHC